MASEYEPYESILTKIKKVPNIVDQILRLKVETEKVGLYKVMRSCLPGRCKIGD